MATNWPRIPALNDPRELQEPLPTGWRLAQIESLFEQLPVGRRFDKKSTSPQGLVPVIDQSESGAIGWHDEEPGVSASPDRPVVTFANHTCEMRWMQRPFSVIQNVFPLIGKSGVCDTRFLYYGTKGRVHTEEYKGHFPDYRRKWIALPPIEEQRRIAHVLGVLDDKIELNRRMSETLYDIAASIFEAMFLVPTHDSSGGSEVTESTIGEEVEVTMGQSPPGSTYNTEGRGLPFYQGRADFGFLFPSRRVYCTAPTRYAQAGDTLLSVRAPVGDTNVAIEDCAIGRGVAALRHKSGSSVFTYFLARSLHVALDQFNGEGTVFGSISKKALLGLACPKPSSATLHAFEEVGAPILQRIRLTVQESHSLASLRDALLPKLISGELRVPEAEQLVSEVA